MKLPIKINKTLFVIVTTIGLNLVTALQPNLLPFYNGMVEFIGNSGLVILASGMESPFQIQKA